MSKHKIIHKFFQHSRPQERDQNSESSDQEPYQLQEVDCNSQFYPQKQSSILDFIDSLRYHSHQDISEEEQQQPNYTARNSMSFNAFSDLQKINARYMTMLGDFQQSDKVEVPSKHSRVRFDGQVRAKYFNSEGMVAQIFDAAQYTSYEQYQQTQDEERQSIQN